MKTLPLNKITRYLEKLNSCPICKNKKDQRVKFYDMDLIISNLNLMECGNCKIIYSSAMTKEDKISYLYSNDFKNSTKKNYKIAGVQVEKNIFNFRNFRLKQIISKWEHEQIISRNFEILDYGCGDGSLVNALLQKGFKAIGADFSVRIKSKNIIKYTELNKKKLKFDLIILRHVLEHTRRPSYFLESISKFLKKNGQIIIEVPNGNYYAYKVFGKFYEHAVPLFHLYFFTNDNIRNVLHSFTVVKSFHNTTGWLAPTVFRMLSKNVKVFGLISAIGTFVTLMIDLTKQEKDSLVFLIKKN